jgi:large subunit ribosomal protein L9
MALFAFPKWVAEFAHKQRIVEHQRKKLRAASEARAQEMAKLQVTLTAKVGEQGKLFGSITSRDVADAISAEGFPVHHRDLKMETIKSIGLHVIDLRLEADVTTQVKVVVAAEQSAEESAEAEEAAATSAESTEESVRDEAAES